MSKSNSSKINFKVCLKLKMSENVILIICTFQGSYINVLVVLGYSPHLLCPFQEASGEATITIKIITLYYI